MMCVGTRSQMGVSSWVMGKTGTRLLTAYNDTRQWSRALRSESAESSTVPLEIRSWFKNKTITDISSWKWRRTFLSILRRSEYRISRFLAASWRAALISLFALPCMKDTISVPRLRRETKSWYSYLVTKH